MPKVTEDQLTKLYYSIGEVANMFDVNTSLIRFWEKEFPTINPKKNKKGKRLFTPKDILRLERIYILVKEEGYTLEGAKKALSSKSTTAVPQNNTNQVVAADKSDIIDRLEELKKRLVRLKTN